MPTRAGDIRFLLERDDGAGGTRYVDDAVLVSVGVGSLRFRSAGSFAPGTALTASLQYGKCRLDVEAVLARRVPSKGAAGMPLYEAAIDGDCAAGVEDLLRRYLAGLPAPRLREVLASVLFERLGDPGEAAADLFFRLAGLFGDMGGLGDKRGFAVGMLEELMAGIDSDWAAVRLDGGGLFASLGERPPGGNALARPVYDRGGRRVGTVEAAASPKAGAAEALDHMALALGRLFGPYEVPASLPREHAMVGACPGMEALRGALAGLKDTDEAVLLVGGPGTGKALYARVLHEEGRGTGAPFYEIDCASLASWGSLPGDTGGGTLFLRNLGTLSPRLLEGLPGILSRAAARGARVVASVRDDADLPGGLGESFAVRLAFPPLDGRGGRRGLVGWILFGPGARGQGAASPVAYGGGDPGHRAEPLARGRGRTRTLRRLPRGRDGGRRNPGGRRRGTQGEDGPRREGDDPAGDRSGRRQQERGGQADGAL